MAAAPADGSVRVQQQNLTAEPDAINDQQIVVTEADPDEEEEEDEGNFCSRRCKRFIEWTYREDDDFETKIRKKAVCIVFIPLLILLFVFLISDTFKVLGWITGGDHVSMGEIKSMIIWVILFYVARFLQTKELTKDNVVVLMFSCLVLALCSDWAGQNQPKLSTEYQVWTPTWPFAVLVMDIILVARLDSWVELASLLGCITWLFFRTTEDCWRWGLYDVPYSVNRTDTYLQCPDDGGACPKECTFLPFVQVMLRTVFVLVCDYAVTRDFRNQSYSAIELAEDVAAAMVRFDLKEADARLHAAKHAPERLIVGFGLLLENLHRYRPFLPDALFLQAEDIDELLPARGAKKDRRRRQRKDKYEQIEGPTSPGAAVGVEGSPIGGRTSVAVRDGYASDSQASSVSRSSRNTGSTAASPRGSRASRSVAGSRASSRSTKARAAARLNPVMQLGLNKRTVCMLGCAVRPWDWVAQGQSNEVEGLVMTWLDTVWASGKATRATILGLRGQTATLVWGSMMKIAVTPACLKAAQCSDAVLKALGRQQFPNGAKAYCAIAVGGVQVGNVGSNDFREHATVGPLPATVRMLACYSEYAKASAVCDRPTAQNVENDFELRHIDRIQVVGSGETEAADRQKPIDVHEIQGAVQQAETDEWMYQLEAQQKGKEGAAAHFTVGLEMLFGKEPDARAALTAFRRHLDESPDDVPVQHLANAAAAYAQLPAGKPFARSAWRDPHWDLFPPRPDSLPPPPPPPPRAPTAADEEGDVSTVSTLATLG
eukprot:TRINITY_DN6539_c0_g3_i1.p1 TRINITY_DN6539_c0_g3~~TRINITY_DN6539_c0_g3_i1.p1  ORF type:complete len:772 (+),score=309.29 TRINITY_DN6539_c0_g3_i1:120-2435(+)